MIAAGVTIAMLPVVLLYLVLQRKFIEGITAGGAEVVMGISVDGLADVIVAFASVRG